MNVNDLRILMSGVAEKEIYQDEYSKTKQELKQEKEDRERDRYLALGVGLALGLLAGR